MKNKIENKGLRLNVFTVISLAAVFALITFIIEPVCVLCSTDITLRSTLLPRVLDILRLLFETCAFAICHSAIIYFAVKRDTRAAFGIFGIYAAECLIRRLCVLLVSFIMYSYIDSSDIFNLCAAFAFECLLALIVTLISSKVASNYKEKKVAQIGGDSSKAEAFKFNTVFSKENPLLRCAFICACILTAYNLIERLIYDIGYGAPNGVAEVIMIIAYYLSDILFGAVFYALCWIILSKLISKDLR